MQSIYTFAKIFATVWPLEVLNELCTTHQVEDVHYVEDLDASMADGFGGAFGDFSDFVESIFQWKDHPASAY